VNLPAWKDSSKEFGIYRFAFKLPRKEIVTGYGARFPKAADQDMRYYVRLAQEAGFRVIAARENAPSFFLELQTPAAAAEVLERELRAQGMESALRTYDALKAKSPNDHYFGPDPLVELSSRLIEEGKVAESAAVFRLALRDYPVKETAANAFGYRLLSAGKPAEAIEIFKTNAERYPASANAFDSLAEAYAVRGQTELAIRNYQKSLELNPENVNAAEMLKKLKP